MPLIYFGTLMVSIAAMALGAWATGWNKGRWAFYAAIGLILFGAGAFLLGYDLANQIGLSFMAAAFVCFFLAGGLLFGLASAWAVRRLRRP
ncbi:hypothetical protein [Neogemmobacter tilapiae]|nr:hypothetical protein [Gemmobacter tilapiae]